MSGSNCTDTEIEAAAWDDRAEELALWAEQTLVNRRDVFGGQFVDGQGQIRRVTRKSGLTPWDLISHFAAGGTKDVIGLHATSPEATCRWVAVDIDAHDGQAATYDGNLIFARLVRNRAVEAGLAAWLFDTSGGRGGFHIWVLFDRPIPMADARRLATWLVRDFSQQGLAKRPDLFPGNHVLTGKGYGTWLRLIGRHHKRPSWAAVWSPKRKIWLRGDDAIDVILRMHGRPVEVAKIVPAEFGIPTEPSIRKPSAWPRSSFDRPTAPGTSRPTGKRHGGAGDRELRLAREALEVYRNNSLDYDDWLVVGMALRNLDNEDEALALWDERSSDSQKYDPELTAAKWRSFRPAHESGGIGLGTLYQRAKDAGWSGPGFAESVNAHGMKLRVHRSGGRGSITIPVRPIGKPGSPHPSPGKSE